jgi:hypothetical protein
MRHVFNADHIVWGPSVEVLKKLNRLCFRRMGDMNWHAHCGIVTAPIIIAARFNIPLIIWGAHQGLEQVGQFSHEHEVEMTRRYRKDHDLMGLEADDLLTIFDTLREDDIWQYRYPDDVQLKSVGVRGIYLGNYVRWDPKAQHEQMLRERGYESAPFNRTFDCYDHVDCFTYMGAHDLLKLYKHGYSKVTDHACREIRFGRITRHQGLALVRAHEQQTPHYFDLLAKWLGADARAMQFMFDQHRNPLFWEQSKPEHYEFRGWSTHQFSTENEPTECLFTAKSTLEHDRESTYVTIGKGWP